MKGVKKVWNFIGDLRRPHGLEIIRLKRMNRYVAGDSHLFGFRFRFVDGLSFAWQYIEIFQREVYKFDTDAEVPFILDCGANVGTSLLYFKQQYKNAEIICFEPDPNVFKALAENVKNAGLQKITLLNKALWNKEGFLSFQKEGADGGRLSLSGKIDSEEYTSVPVVQLRQYICRRIDLLKMDIEGAEADVIEDCEDLLHHVRNIFIEYHSSVDEPQRLHDILGVLCRAGFRYNVESVTLENKNPFLHRSVINGFDNLVNIYGWKY